MVDLSPFGIDEVVGTDGNDRFTGRTNAAFFGAGGNDTFRAAETAPLFFGFDEGQAFLGGRGADSYLLPGGTSTIIGDGGGSNGDSVQATWIDLDADDTFALELDGRHLGVLDEGSRSIMVILDWLDPQRVIETFEIANGTFRLGQDLTVRDIRGFENFLGDFSLDEAADVGGLSPDLVAFTRDGIDAVLARADELDEGPPEPRPGGTSGDDVLIGDASDDVVDGLGGDDRIEGRGGDDTLSGDGGNDQIFGGGGSDRIAGGGGDDVVLAGAGDDEVQGGRDGDIVQGGAGRDRVSGGGGPDVLAGGGGQDRLEGDGRQDTLRGGRGDDVLSGGAGSDLLLGNQGSDRLDGGAGGDRLDGGPDDDLFIVSSLAGPPDVVLDFDLVAGDRLSLSEILSGFDAGSALEDFVQIAAEDDRTTIAVDPGGTGTSFSPAVILDGVSIPTLSLADLGLPEAEPALA